MCVIYILYICNILRICNVHVQHIYIQMCNILIHTFQCVCVYIYTYIHKYTYIYQNTYIYIHTYIYKPGLVPLPGVGIPLDPDSPWQIWAPEGSVCPSLTRFSTRAPVVSMSGDNSSELSLGWLNTVQDFAGVST